MADEKLEYDGQYWEEKIGKQASKLLTGGDHVRRLADIDPRVQDYKQNNNAVVVEVVEDSRRSMWAQKATVTTADQLLQVQL